MPIIPFDKDRFLEVALSNEFIKRVGATGIKSVSDFLGKSECDVEMYERSGNIMCVYGVMGVGLDVKEIFMIISNRWYANIGFSVRVLRDRLWGFVDKGDYYTRYRIDIVKEDKKLLRWVSFLLKGKGTKTSGSSTDTFTFTKGDLWVWKH